MFAEVWVLARVRIGSNPSIPPLYSPKHKFIRITKDDSFSADLHYLSNTPAKAEAACAYDLDQCDEAWLRVVNGERALSGASPVSEEQFERVIEELEVSASSSDWAGAQ